MNPKRQLLFFSGFLLVYQLATYLANDMYIPALPSMVDYFGCSREAVEWTVAAFIIGSPLCVLFVGPLSETYGRRPCLLLSGLLFIVSSIGCTMAGDIHSLIFLRLLEGGVTAFIMVAGYATVQEVFHGKEGFAILGRMMSIAVLAPALGPVIGSFLLKFGSWHISFYVVAAMASIALVGLYKTMPAEQKQHSTQTMLSPLKSYASLLRNTGFCLGSVLSGLILAEFFAWITLSPAMLISYFGVSVQTYGCIQVPVVGAFSCSSLSTERLVRKYEPEFLVKVGFALNLLGCAYFAISSIFRALPLVDLVLAMTMCSLGAGIVMPLLNRLSLFMGGAVSMNYRTALYQLLYVCTGVFCSILMSRCYTLYPHPRAFGFYISVLGVLAGLGMFFRHQALKRKTPPEGGADQKLSSEAPCKDETPMLFH
jgi:MFS family permease